MYKNLFEIKKLTVADLVKKAAAIKKDLSELIMDKNMKKLKDLKTISKKRIDLAQILTVIRQKQLLGEIEVQVKGKS